MKTFDEKSGTKHAAMFEDLGGIWLRLDQVEPIVKENEDLRAQVAALRQEITNIYSRL
jgi:hypothetical protein